MSLQIFVTFGSTDDISTVRLNDSEILETLGSSEEKIAVQLKDILESVKNVVRDSLDSEGELQIEISGTLDIKASGGINYLFYNISGEANKTNTMKVTLTTKIPSTPE
ncbi:MAG: hypothetical protein AAF702_45645 [Chloroflexota bacterium]